MHQAHGGMANTSIFKYMQNHACILVPLTLKMAQGCILMNPTIIIILYEDN